jgi:hypothetical protein
VNEDGRRDGCDEENGDSPRHGHRVAVDRGGDCGRSCVRRQICGRCSGDDGVEQGRPRVIASTDTKAWAPTQRAPRDSLEGGIDHR